VISIDIPDFHGYVTDLIEDMSADGEIDVHPFGAYQETLAMHVVDVLQEEGRYHRDKRIVDDEYIKLVIREEYDRTATSRKHGGY
jgi:hypothetical protein